MTIQTRPPLDSFADWIRATDAHARHRLDVLERAERLLAEGGDAPAEQRQTLCVKLERWRYQHLNERAGNLSATDVALTEALDLAANELAGRAPRPPRSPRAALRTAAQPSRPVAETAACLDSGSRLEDLVQRAGELTQERFGPLAESGSPAGRKRQMLLYAPLYLSNECVNHCPYCGFSYRLDVRRTHLTFDQAMAEAEILRGRGFRHILLVAGDFPSRTTTAYYAELIRALVARGVRPAIEVAPQSTHAYEQLVEAGACGITLYQETYDESLYRSYHRRGPKASFDWRLEGIERAAEAGIGRLGLGILLGLADPEEDFLRLVGHAAYLADRFGDRVLAFGLPRLHETPDDFQIPYQVSDDELVRLYSTLRIAFPTAELVLSTRETAALRARLARICITQMSAGSSTAPGGYGEAGGVSGEQFPIEDQRSPAEVAAWLSDAGFQPAWDVPSS